MNRLYRVYVHALDSCRDLPWLAWWRCFVTAALCLLVLRVAQLREHVDRLWVPDTRERVCYAHEPLPGGLVETINVDCPKDKP